MIENDRNCNSASKAKLMSWPSTNLNGLKKRRRAVSWAVISQEKNSPTCLKTLSKLKMWDWDYFHWFEQIFLLASFHQHRQLFRFRCWRLYGFERTCHRAEPSCSCLWVRPCRWFPHCSLIFVLEQLQHFPCSRSVEVPINMDSTGGRMKHANDEWKHHLTTAENYA